MHVPTVYVLASSPGLVVSIITLGRQLGLVKILYDRACHVGKLYRTTCCKTSCAWLNLTKTTALRASYSYRSFIN